MHVTRGQLMLNGARMASGDGAAAVQEPKLLLATGAEAVLFNLP